MGDREAETQAEGEAGLTQGALCGTRSRDPGSQPGPPAAAPPRSPPGPFSISFPNSPDNWGLGQLRQTWWPQRCLLSQQSLCVSGTTFQSRQPTTGTAEHAFPPAVDHLLCPEAAHPQSSALLLQTEKPDPEGHVREAGDTADGWEAGL